MPIGSAGSAFDTRRQNPTRLLFVLIIGVLFRLLLLYGNWGQDPTYLLSADSYGYFGLAHNLLEGNGYSWDTQAPYKPNVYRPPGMPLLLWNVFHSVGEHLEWFILLQIIGASLTTLIVYRLGTLLAGQPIGLLSAFLLAIDPISVVFSNFLLTEVFSALFITASFFYSARYVRSGNRVYLIVTGLILAVGISFHPILLFLPVLLAVLPFLREDLRKWRKDVLVAFLACIIAFIPATAWTIRNKVVSDYAGISCVAAVNILKYKAAGVLAIINRTSREQERDRLTIQCETMLPSNATDGQRWRLWESVGKRIILEHPSIYLKMHFMSAGYELLAPGRDYLTRFLYQSSSLTDKDGVVNDEILHKVNSMDRSHWRPMVQASALFIHFGTLLLSFMGAVILALTKRWRLLLCLLIPIFYILNLTAGPEAESRFRVIYAPFLCILAGVAFDYISKVFFQSKLLLNHYSGQS